MIIPGEQPEMKTTKRATGLRPRATASEDGYMRDLHTPDLTAAVGGREHIEIQTD
jgi:hypothetical protein